MNEALITINGNELTERQSTVIRLALVSFMQFLVKDTSLSVAKHITATKEVADMIDATPQVRG